MRLVLRQVFFVFLLGSFFQCEPKGTDGGASGKKGQEAGRTVLVSSQNRTEPLPKVAMTGKLRLASASGRPGEAAGSQALPLAHVENARFLVEAPPFARAAAQDGAPISLTASDGTGLTLKTLRASAVVQGPLAFTELHLTFVNPLPRQLEGRFSIVLPQGAAVSRFAMLLPSGWQEAEVVERQAARRAYEDFLHRRQDPALLEHEAGNQFSARVFPIAASATKEIKLSYSQELRSADEPYRLPLVGLPELSELFVTAIFGNEVTDVIKRNFKPERDLIIQPTVAARAEERASGLHSEDLVAARVTVGSTGDANERSKSGTLGKVVLLFDTSASRAAGFAARVSELGELVASLAQRIGQSSEGAASLLTVAAFDQSAEEIYDGPAAGFGSAQLAKLRERGALGASNLQAALQFAEKKGKRVLILTDGVVTAGATHGELGEAAARLKAAGFSRMDVITSGGIRDDAAMTSLVRGHLPEDGMVIDGAKGIPAALSRLQRATLSGVRVAMDGASWVYPQELQGVQPGDEVLVYAQLGENVSLPREGALATIHFSGPINEERQAALPAVSRPLLERAIVRAYLGNLNERLLRIDSKTAKEEAAALRKEIIALSTRFRVLSDFTALLVLETEEDYARFGIDRKALADILTVGERGIELSRRSGAVVFEANRNPAPSSQNKLQVAAGNSPERKAIAPAEAPVLDSQPAGNSVLGAPPAEEKPEPESEGQAARSLGQVFGRTSALGRDADDALGGLVDTEVGESFGAGGLGLVGSGRGGGGTGSASTVTLGSLGTIGRGSGSGTYGASARRTGSGPPPEVVPGTAEVQGALDRELIRRIVRRHINEVKFCYEHGLAREPQLRGRVMIRFEIATSGLVGSSVVESSTLGNPAVESCIVAAVRRWTFPQIPGGSVTVRYPFVLTSDDESQSPSSAPSEEEGDSSEEKIAAYSGPFAEVMALLAKKKTSDALAQAQKWREKDPGDILALVALGEALEASADKARAARAYGSIIDLYPSRADMRRFAGERLERIGDSALALAADTFARAVEQRPDHPASHRLRGYALLRQGDLEGAFTALEAGASRRYPAGRFAGVDRILREDLGLIAAAYLKKNPGKKKEIEARLAKLGASLPMTPSLRFVLNWETDANDVDFHIHDGKGGHAFFSDPSLPSGGELYADVTTGYGPECFTISGKPTAYPYKLEAHYYSRGPMGYGMGKLEILWHDGSGTLKFIERPFIVMNDQAYVNLGTIESPL